MRSACSYWLCWLWCLLGLVGLCLAVTLSDADTLIPSEVNRENRQAAAIASVVVPFVVNVAKTFIKAIINNWLDPDNVDVVILGRAVRIHKDNDHQVTETDKASGVHVTLAGASIQDATNKASEQLVRLLLQKGVMSIDDLHLPPTIPPTTQPPCLDNNGSQYCRNMVTKGYCAQGNIFYTFMNDNCRKSCTLCQ